MLFSGKSNCCIHQLFTQTFALIAFVHYSMVNNYFCLACKGVGHKSDFFSVLFCKELAFSFMLLMLNLHCVILDFFGNSSNYLLPEGDSEGVKTKELNFRRMLYLLKENQFRLRNILWFYTSLHFNNVIQKNNLMKVFGFKRQVKP